MSVRERRSRYESIPDGPDHSVDLRSSFYVTFKEEISWTKNEKVSRFALGLLAAIAVIGCTGLETLLISRSAPKIPLFSIILVGATVNLILVGAIGYGFAKLSKEKAQTSALSLHNDVYSIRGRFDLNSSHLSRGVDGQLARDGYKIKFSDQAYFLEDLAAFNEELRTRGISSYEKLIKTLSTQGPIDLELMKIADLVRESKREDHFTDFFSAIILPNDQGQDQVEPVFVIHDSSQKISTIQTKVKRSLEGLEGEKQEAGIYDVILVVEWRTLNKLLTISPAAEETP